MEADYPHEIKRFSDGETLHFGWIELSEDEFSLLDPMTPDQRAEWLKENGRRSAFGKLSDLMKEKD